MTLGENLTRLRAQKGLSQGDVADALDVSRQSVSKWETNGSVPELDKLMRLADLFGVTLDELVKGEQPRPSDAEHVPAVESAASETVAERTGISGAQKVVGTILLCFGALIALLVLGLSGTLAGVILATPFLLCGVVCLTVRRRAGLWCAWLIYLCEELYLRIASGITWTVIFRTFQWTEEMNYVRLGMAWMQALFLLAMLVGTLRSYRTLAFSGSRKQLGWILSGWLVFFAVGFGQSALLRWIGKHDTYLLRSGYVYFTLHHVLDLIRIGLFVVLFVCTAALWRGRRKAGEAKREEEKL